MNNESFSKFKVDRLNKRINSKYNLLFKRIIDILLSFIIIILITPIMIIIIFLQIIFNGFPIFYRPLRGGYKGFPFRILKFRSMIKNADKIGEGTTGLNDSRITKFGNFLRKTKLDEIPQIFNVFLGRMSLIGPRPELIKYTSSYDELNKMILSVRPGITDFSSLEFINLDEVVGGEKPELQYELKVLRKKNYLRLKYVNEISFKTDLVIFIKTIKKVFIKFIKYFFRGK